MAQIQTLEGSLSAQRKRVICGDADATCRIDVTRQNHLGLDVLDQHERRNPSMANDEGLASSSLNSTNDTLDVDALFKDVLPCLASAVRSSNGLPCGQQYDYYTSFKQFLELMNVEGDRALQLLRRILKQSGVKSQLASTDMDIDLDDRMESLIDANDQLIERINNSLDEAVGLRKTPAEAQLIVASSPANTPAAKGASWNTKKTPDNSTQKPMSHRLLAARFVQRPQLQFKEKVDNSNRPFQPKLKSKPNALISLRESLTVEHKDEAQEMPNPYKYEIEKLTFSEEQLNATEPKDPIPPNESSDVKYIDTPEQLDKLMDEISMETELAIDLEAHQYRTFQGLTCLMQLSTRTQDYIIDTLKLRSELVILNEIFTDPKIVKVFHGADGDILWLQRDLGLYIVNMFDTHQACQVLGGFSRNTLAYLLQRYCGVKADKQFQMADWRIRPLPQELINYAREDTHYLLYIYDKMKNALVERGNQNNNLLTSVLDRSREICLRTYTKPAITDEAIRKILLKSKKNFNNRQMYALRAIYEWRFKLAQQEDESMAYIMPNHILLQISDVLPRESSGVLACCNPIPPLVRQHLHEIHSLVLEAREQPMVAVQATQSIPSQQDHEHQHKQSHDMSILDGNIKLPNRKFMSSTCKKMVTAIEKFRTNVSAEVLEKVHQIRDSFVSPLQHYNPVKFIDYSQPLKEREAAAQKRSQEEEAVKDNSASETDSPVQHEYIPPEKRMKNMTSEASTSRGITEAEEGEIVDQLKQLRQKTTKKKKKKGATAMRKREPVASAPSKAFSQPSEDFKAYDYSNEDYSEFKPPRQESAKQKHKKLVKEDKKNTLKSGKFRPGSQKSHTYKNKR